MSAIKAGSPAASRMGAQTLRAKAKPYLFLAPMLLFAAAFIYYPFFKTFLFSFTTVNFMGEITGWAGLDNFRYLFSRRDFSTALTNSLKLTAMNVPLTLIITITLALLATRRRKLSPVYETMFALPMAVSMSAAAMIFKALLSPATGYLNALLGLRMGWLESKAHALYGILMLTVWMGIGFDYLLFLSAFRAIPTDLTEAAIIDGAGFMTSLVRVRLPLVSPTLLYVGCTNMVLAMMTSGPIIILTQGGPARSTTTLMYMMYTSGYGSSNYSLSACLSIVTFALTFALTLAAFLLERRGVHYE
ncbi:MAG: carbohydrate ABC transporter permease [Christensenellales bacterium]|jgi:sn-glycerol 3-phosphate transport system permease protein